MKRMFFSLLGLLAVAIGALAADTTPAFPGGEEAMKQFVADNMIYPAQAKANGIEGVVDVAFVVRRDGSIGTIKIVRLIDPDLEQEAIRIVKKMPAWTPATHDGEPVDAPVDVNIVFELPGE